MKLCALAIVLALSTVSPAGAQTTTVGSIRANPQTFDGQHVTVTGTVSRLRTKTSQRGNPYETFSLCDNGCIQVFTFGQPSSVAAGARVTVSGTFSAVKHVGRYTFRNEIEADRGSLR